MFNNIETKRLFLKCIEKDDREFIFMEFTDDFINRYLYDEEPMENIERADELIEFYLEQEPRNQNRWIIINKMNHDKMGTCGFHLWDRETGEVEIGFELMEKYNGNGYMAESVSALISFAKNEMKANRIKAIAYLDNIKCINVLKKAGFAKKGIEETMFRGKSHMHDVYIKDINTEET